jgi:hypothetical protein
VKTISVLGLTLFFRHRTIARFLRLEADRASPFFLERRGDLVFEALLWPCSETLVGK